MNFKFSIPHNLVIVFTIIIIAAAHIGFAGAILNPFTVGIAQGLASVPLFTGIEYRTLCWLIITFISIAFVLIYAVRIPYVKWLKWIMPILLILILIGFLLLIPTVTMKFNGF